MNRWPIFARPYGTLPSEVPRVLVTYRFDGPADDIYATLVVRLHHTVAFPSIGLWKSAADFKTQTGMKLGFTFTREAEGSPMLEVYFETEPERKPPNTPNTRKQFVRSIPCTDNVYR